jgi:hypothetical protein
MAVDDLNLLRTFRSPNEAYAELVVDSDAVLSDTISLQGFELVTRRHA